VKFSIITPSYNQAQFIRETINSVLSQKGDFELEYIIIDGASNDGTVEILHEFQDKALIISEPDSGQSEAINKGFRMATGDIIAWLNSDDLYLGNTLQNVFQYFLQNPEKEWLYGKCHIINTRGDIVRKWITGYKNLRQKRFHLRKLLRENFISQPAVFFRKELLETVGGVDGTLDFTMDYDLWIRMSKISTPGYLDAYLAKFRRHNVSKSETSYTRQFEEQFDVMKKYSNSGYDAFIHSLLNFRTIYTYKLLNLFKQK